MSDSVGFTFTVPEDKRKLTPEEERQKVMEMLDKPLEEVVKQVKAGKPHGDSDRSRRNRDKYRPRDEKPKIVYLHLSDRELDEYLSMADIEADTSAVRLRLVLTRRT